MKMNRARAMFMLLMALGINSEPGSSLWQYFPLQLIQPTTNNQEYLQQLTRQPHSTMPEQQIIVVEVDPSLNEHDEQQCLEKSIDHAESKIEDLRGEMSSLNKEIHKLERKTKKLAKSNERFEDVIFRAQHDGAPRSAVVSGLETLKQGEKTCSDNEKRLLEMDLKALELQKEMQEWEAVRDELKTSQEELKFDKWMRREEGLPYEDWKKSKYSRD